MTNQPPTPHTKRIQDDRGSISPMIYMLIPALIAFAGLTYDGGLAFAARREANNVASAAARAGANVVTEESLFLGQPELAPQAPSAAEVFALNQGMNSATARQIQPHILEIDVETEFQTLFLSIIGIQTIEIDGTARATVRSAVEDSDDG